MFLIFDNSFIKIIKKHPITIIKGIVDNLLKRYPIKIIESIAENLFKKYPTKIIKSIVKSIVLIMMRHLKV